MDELESSAALLVARFAAEPTQILYDTQVVAIMLDSGAIEVGFGRFPIGWFEYAAGAWFYAAATSMS
jgi:hypothetical protein